MYYIYSLKCKDGYYIGCTNDLKKKFTQHTQGKVTSTQYRLPVRLQFYFAVVDKYVAYRFEKYLKSGNGRAFMNKRLLFDKDRQD